MVKNHIKRLTVPNTWKGIAKKENVYIMKPRPGPHARELSMPLALLLKQIGVAKTMRECRYVLHNTEVFVDGRRVKDTHFPVGVFDVLTLAGTKESFRMLLDRKGKLDLVKIEKNSDRKVCRINGKKIIAAGKVQLNLSDGRNILVDKSEYKVGDSLVLELPSQKVAQHLALAQKAHIILMGGKHRGDHGEVAKVEDATIVYKNNEGKEIQTLREYAYVMDKTIA